MYVCNYSQPYKIQSVWLNNSIAIIRFVYVITTKINIGVETNRQRVGWTNVINSLNVNGIIERIKIEHKMEENKCGIFGKRRGSRFRCK